MLHKYLWVHVSGLSGQPIEWNRGEQSLSFAMAFESPDPFDPDAFPLVLVLSHPSCKII